MDDARRTFLLLIAAVLAVGPSLGARAPEELARVDDAFVEQAAGGDGWTIGNRHLAYRLGLSADGELEVQGLERAGGESLVDVSTGDALFTDDAVSAPLGGRNFRFSGAEAHIDGTRVVLTLAFSLRDRATVVERRYSIGPDVPVIEMWTAVQSRDRLRLRDVDGVVLAVRGRDAWWCRGHETPDDQGGPFTRQTARLDDGQHVEFGSTALSSLEAMPWFGVSDGRSQLVSGLAWSGSWRATLDGTASGARVRVGLAETTVTLGPGDSHEFPHAFVAVTGTGAGDVGAAIGAWLRQRRDGREFPALSTYNTWFTFGIEIDDALVRRQMDSFAAIGGELFQLDAGWYPPLDPRDHFDFSAGLGSWRVDEERFPEGLGVLSDHAHQVGLKFGVWVEPERVDLVLEGRPGLFESRYLAMHDGAYQPGRDNAEADAAQICLGEGDGWMWVRDRLFGFLDEARPDYVKFDLNGWLVCNREDHVHGRDGGNYAHVTGVYRLFDALRERYPGIVIENVAGGARRLDMELLTRADVAWMDDRTTPAARVRHHLESLSAIVPPGALLSYLMAHPDEPMMEADDFPLLARSRMPGVMGLAVDFRGMGEGDHNQIGAQIEAFKGLRGLRGRSFAAVLTPPVGVDQGGPGWDVIAHVNPESGTVVVYAFRNREGDRHIQVALTHLKPDATYRIRSLDRGALGEAVGATLMGRGLEIDASEQSSAQILILEPQ